MIHDVLTDENIVRLESRGAIMFRYTLADGSAAFNVHVAVHQNRTYSVFHLLPGSS